MGGTILFIIIPFLLFFFVYRPRRRASLIAARDAIERIGKPELDSNDTARSLPPKEAIIELEQPADREPLPELEQPDKKPLPELEQPWQVFEVEGQSSQIYELDSGVPVGMEMNATDSEIEGAKRDVV